jgi:phosphoribosyl 1,2-cyclic phosphodiesterase
MQITIWGCRGSIPVSGLETSRFGGSTTCVEIRLEDGSLIILDAGTGVRRLGKKLAGESESREITFILTHAHWDHLMGFPFFAPAFGKDWIIHVRGGPIAKETLRRYLAHQMEPPFFPVSFSAMKAQFDFTHGIPKIKQVGSAEISPIALSHPNGGYGFRIEEAGKSFVFLTDNELGYVHDGGATMTDYIRFCRKADLLLHDSQYTFSEYETHEGWGHSTFRDTINLAIDAGVKRLGFFHHDPDRSDDDLNRIVAGCRRTLTERKVPLDCFCAAEGQRVSL